MHCAANSFYYLTIAHPPAITFITTISWKRKIIQMLENFYLPISSFLFHSWYSGLGHFFPPERNILFFTSVSTTGRPLDTAGCTCVDFPTSSDSKDNCYWSLRDIYLLIPPASLVFIRNFLNWQYPTISARTVRHCPLMIHKCWGYYQELNSYVLYQISY